MTEPNRAPGEYYVATYNVDGVFEIGAQVSLMEYQPEGESGGPRVVKTYSTYDPFAKLFANWRKFWHNLFASGAGGLA